MIVRNAFLPNLLVTVLLILISKFLVVAFSCFLDLWILKSDFFQRNLTAMLIY